MGLRVAQINQSPYAAVHFQRLLRVMPKGEPLLANLRQDKIESLIELLRPHGILEMVRTGQVAMMRGHAEGRLDDPALLGG